MLVAEWIPNCADDARHVCKGARRQGVCEYHQQWEVCFAALQGGLDILAALSFPAEGFLNDVTFLRTTQKGIISPNARLGLGPSNGALDDADDARPGTQ